MHFTRLKYRSFRNLEQAEFDPGPGINVLWGNNAQGKTNTLEGIYLLGHLKSFRTSHPGEFLKTGSASAGVASELDSNGVHVHLDLHISPEGRELRINGKSAGGAAALLDHVRQVLFSPEEVGVVRGPPAGRRNLLDRAIFQVDPGHLAKVQVYNRCLRQRNHLLKDQKPARETDPWTQALVEAGSFLRGARGVFVERLSPLFRETYHAITAGEESAEFRYPEGTPAREELPAVLAEQLFRRRDQERRLGMTLAGPHRDDPGFFVDGLDLRTFGSQGQQRSFILAFKTALVQFLEQVTGQTPVLLLDDITSELDSQRRKFFFNFLGSRAGQVFITTTDPGILPPDLLHGARFFRVESGALREDHAETRQI